MEKKMASISTSGWDVVSVTDIDTMNKIINLEGKELYPSEFAESITILNNVLKIVGEWDTWEMLHEASGKKISFRCHIKAGNVEFYNKDDNKHYEMNTNGTLSYLDIEVALDGIVDDPKKWIENDKTSILTATTQCFKLMITQKEKIIVTSSTFTNEQIGNNNLALFCQNAFQLWFNNNIEAFGQIFSIVLIGLEASQGDFQWLKPSAYSYAANNSIDGKTAAFGTLALIDGKTDINERQQTIDVGALQIVKPFGANAALIISKTMFVKHILLKAAVNLIKNTTEEDFEISETGLSLSNKKEMVWQDFEGEDGIWSPLIPKNSFILTLQSDHIYINISNAHYRPRAGVTVYMSLEQNFKYKVEKNKKGEPIFVPDEKGMGDAHVYCHVELDKWLNWLSLVTGIITSIASVFALGIGVAGAISKGAQATLIGSEATRTASFSFKLLGIPINLEKLAPIAIDIQNGIARNPTVFNAVKLGFTITAATTGITFGAIMIANAIYNEKYNDVPSFRVFADNLTGAIQWPRVENMELKSATLADSFVIGLNIT